MLTLTINDKISCPSSPGFKTYSDNDHEDHLSNIEPDINNTEEYLSAMCYDKNIDRDQRLLELDVSENN